MKNSRFAAICSVFVATAVSGAVPVTFQSGTPAQASQVNQNFQALDNRLGAVIKVLVTAGYSAAATGVAGVSCASGSIPISANCTCSDNNGANNFGVLFGCSVSGNGAVAGCFPEALTYTSAKPFPRAEVTALCASGYQENGAPLFSTNQAQSAQNQSMFETALGELTAKLQAYEAILTAK